MTTTDSGETTRHIDVFEERPLDFKGDVEVAACYVEAKGKILLLQYGPDKLAVGLWGVPGGKMEAGETPLEGALRELYEETGVTIMRGAFRPFPPLYIRKPEVDFVYHLFGVTLEAEVAILLSREHQNYCWLEPALFDTITLVEGARAAFVFLTMNYEL